MKNIIKKILKEEFDSDSDWDWIENVPLLIPGQDYLIKSGNGIFWNRETFVGKEMVTSPNGGSEYLAYKFKTKNSHSAISAEYFDEKIEKGEVILYEEGWSILDNIDQSDNLNDIEGRDFVIYFKNGIDIDKTIPIQKQLLDMGFKFYNHKGYITSEDGTYNVKFIECINWDNSHPSFRNMPNDDRDNKILLLAKYDHKDHWFHRDNERELQEDLWIVSHHKALLIDGYKLLQNYPINEEFDSDWDWMEDISANAYEGVRTTNDYMQVWDELAYEFQEVNAPIKNGYVISNDYDGEIDIELILSESESQPFGGRIKIYMEVLNISDENEWDMEWSFDVFSYTDGGYEDLVITEKGQFYSGGMVTILQPIRDEIKKLKSYFFEEGIIKEWVGEWPEFEDYSIDETIKHFIITNMSDMFEKYNNGDIVIELEGGEIVFLFVGDGVHVDYFTSWPEFMDGFNIYDTNLEDMIDTATTDMESFTTVTDLEGQYVNKLKEIIPVKRAVFFKPWE